MKLRTTLANIFFRRFMWKLRTCLHLALLLASPLLLTTASAEQATKRVLIISAYDTNLPGFVALNRAIRSTVKDSSPGPVELFYEAQENKRIPIDKYEQELVNYLRLKYAGEKFDLIITVGARSLKFLSSHKTELFSDTPKLFFFFDETEETALNLMPDSTGIWAQTGIAETVELALALHPETQKVVVVLGKIDSYKFRREQARNELQKYEGKLQIDYATDLTIEELKDTVAALPKNTIVLFIQFSIDRLGNTFSGPEALSKIAPTSSAPIYGTANTFIGAGAVGGKVLDFDVLGARTGEMALRILAGERPQDIRPQRVTNLPVFDWRELRRWGIREDRLPPGSIVLFRVPSVWDEYKWYLLGIVFLILLQSALISGLLMNRSRFKTAEGQNRQLIHRLRALSERLRTAKEEEGIRIARELHDELGSTLTSLKWSLERFDKGYLGEAKRFSDGDARTKIEEMGGLIDATVNTVRRISSELRPLLLDDLGLITAIKWQARQFQEQTKIECRLNSQLEHVVLSREQSITLFRIFQEAMTNVLRHAQATNVNILIRKDEGEFVLEVSDMGRGITESEKQGTGSLGLLGMRERAHSIGARIEIEGIAGQGTTLTVRLPLSS